MTKLILNDVILFMNILKSRQNKDQNLNNNNNNDNNNDNNEKLYNHFVCYATVVYNEAGAPLYILNI